jgi:hypothetical protein
MNVWDFGGGGFLKASETWPDDEPLEAVAARQGYVPVLTLGGRLSLRVFTKPDCTNGEYEFIAAVRLGPREYPVRVLSFPRLVDLLNTLAPIIRLEAEQAPFTYHGGNGHGTAPPLSEADPVQARAREPDALPACWGG